MNKVNLRLRLLMVARRLIAVVFGGYFLSEDLPALVSQSSESNSNTTGASFASLGFGRVRWPVVGRGY